MLLFWGSWNNNPNLEPFKLCPQAIYCLKRVPDENINIVISPRSVQFEEKKNEAEEGEKQKEEKEKEEVQKEDPEK